MGGRICKEDIGGKFVKNLQYLVKYFQAVCDIEGNCEFCLDSFILDGGGGGVEERRKRGGLV